VFALYVEKIKLLKTLTVSMYIWERYLELISIYHKNYFSSIPHSVWPYGPCVTISERSIINYVDKGQRNLRE